MCALPTSTLQRQAFTLIEMLAGVAILAILMAILFPVAGRMIESGRLAKSTSNLRQIGSAMQLYLNEKGTWPAADGKGILPYWRKDLVQNGYLGDKTEGLTSQQIDEIVFNHPVLSCPLQNAIHKNAARKASFAMNQNIGNQAVPQPWHGPRNPLTMDALSKALLVSNGPWKPTERSFSLTVYPSASAAVMPMPVYKEQANVLFADGHVTLMRVADMPTSAAGTGTAGSLFWNGR
jgi:prepilin-type N-terminal cleavage/methylation domain-containing protein/prepilin-type processing-associated H-X9-DG protein